jgi:iron(III) transport system permease protein
VRRNLRGEQQSWALQLANRLLGLLRSPYHVLGVIFMVVFGYLIVVPLAEIILASLRVQDGDVRRIGEPVGTWTSYYWNRIFLGPLSGRLFYEPLINTAVISAGFTLIGMSLGTTLAWLLLRTDIGMRRFIGFAAIIPYILPSWTLALAWITFFGNNRVGIGAAGVMQAVVGITPPDWLGYGPIPIMIVLGVNYSAYSFLLASAAFATIDSRLEEAAVLHGVPQGRILRSITLPIILPALGSAMILTFANGIGTFGVPAFLGTPVRYNVLATSIYQSASIGRFGDAFALTLVLVGIAGAIIVLNNLVMGRRRQFTTMTGKGSTYKRLPLGRLRLPITIVATAFVAIAAFVPVILLTWQSFQLRLGDFSLANLTTAYWIGEVYSIKGILVSERVQAAAVNTLVTGLTVGVLTAFLGLLVGYVVTKKRGTLLARAVEQVSFIPFVIPGIALAAIYLTMFAQPRGPIPSLYGTVWILILAFVVARLPFASRSGISAMMQIGGSLEEAAEIHGAGFWTRFWSVLFPLAKRGFLTGFILSFVATVKDLSIVVLLATPKTMMLSALTFGYVDLGQRQFADAIGVVIVSIVLIMTFLVQWITKTNPLQGFGGDGK